ncbi:MAG TPA: DUF488 family protein [Candidatus Dormibacteraeota bacterium]
MATKIEVQRVYDRKAVSRGKRILVDRVWPRGIKKEALHLDQWLRELAPSTPLRKWFGHDPKKWPEFQRRYREELRQPGQRERLRDLAALVRQGPVTLLYSARDEEHNQAVALRGVLEDSVRNAK